MTNRERLAQGIPVLSVDTDGDMHAILPVFLEAGIYLHYMRRLKQIMGIRED